MSLKCKAFSEFAANNDPVWHGMSALQRQFVKRAFKAGWNAMELRIKAQEGAELARIVRERPMATELAMLSAEPMRPYATYNDLLRQFPFEPPKPAVPTLQSKRT